MKQIPLTRGLFATVDDEDFESLSKHRWFAVSGRGLFYAVRTVRAGRSKKTIRMHRELLGMPPGLLVCDHRNGNSLDNRRENLRCATVSQNAQNTTSSHNQKRGGFKGVRHRHGKWSAQYTVPNPAGGRGRIRHLGYFATAEEAARAYDAAAVRAYGEFASLNFPEKRMAKQAKDEWKERKK